MNFGQNKGHTNAQISAEQGIELWTLWLEDGDRNKCTHHAAKKSIKRELNPKIDFSSFEHLGIAKQQYKVFFKLLAEQLKKN